jgi:hypothetical protein
MQCSAFTPKSGDAVLLLASVWRYKPKHPESEDDSAKEVVFPNLAKQEKVVFFLPFMAIDFHSKASMSG